MKRVLSSIDLVCVTRELLALKGAFVKKIYQVGDEIVFHLFHEGEKKVLRVVVGKLIHLSSYLKENPQVPSNFCMYLRKYLRGAQLVGVSQPRYERIVVLRFRGSDGLLKVYFELFGSGNVIVTTDDDVIKQSLFVQRFSARTIKHGEVYSLPPSDYDLSSPDFVSFKRLVKGSDKPDLVRALAIDVGLGGTYAEESCLQSGVDKTINPELISDEQLRGVFDSILDLVKRAKYLPLEPRVILSGERVVDVIPFPLSVYEGKSFKEFQFFNDALDFFYARSSRLEYESARQDIFSDKRSKLEGRVKHYEEHVSDLRNKASLLKARAMALKTNLYLVERIIDSLISARKSGYSWSDINSMIIKEQEEGSTEAQLIKELRPDDNLVIIDLADGVRMPLNVNVTDFMDGLFERAKKLESKIDGAVEAVERAKEELESLSIKDVIVEQSVPKRSDSSGKEWFEQFKWFRTSDGLLVISGRDAQQNELLIRKYLEPDDLVFHADIHGSPFTLLRKGRDSSDDSRLEAAKFTAAHSRAWSEGVAVDVYFVKPFQVSKEAPSGEYLRTGGFMIKGHKEYVKSVKPELCLGVELIGELNYRLVSGPCSALRFKAKGLVTLESGRGSESDVINDLRDYFRNKGFLFSYETIKAALPDGGLRVVKKI